VSGATQDTTRSALVFDYGTITPFGHPFQSVRLTAAFHVVVLQPRWDKSNRFGLFRFRSPLLTESILFLFLRVLRCFTSPRVTLPALCIQAGVILHYQDWVAPFGYLRIKACVPLPEAFRSLLRPSSSDVAKASTNGCNWFMQTLQYSRRLSYPLTFSLSSNLNFQRTKLIAFPALPARSRRHPQAWRFFFCHGGPRWT
jgi:hypothetical protein